MTIFRVNFVEMNVYLKSVYGFRYVTHLRSTWADYICKQHSALLILYNYIFFIQSIKLLVEACSVLDSDFHYWAPLKLSTSFSFAGLTLGFRPKGSQKIKMYTLHLKLHRLFVLATPIESSLNQKMRMTSISKLLKMGGCEKKHYKNQCLIF